jgi:hypothetical protein
MDVQTILPANAVIDKKAMAIWRDRMHIVPNAGDYVFTELGPAYTISTTTAPESVVGGQKGQKWVGKDGKKRNSTVDDRRTTRM